MKTVYELRKEGYKVRVNHYRYYGQLLLSRHEAATANSLDVLNLQAKGGLTQVTVTTPDGSITIGGDAECSRKDNFCYKAGLRIALGRVMDRVEREVLAAKCLES